MINCLIIDDEISGIEILTHHIQKTSALKLIGSTNSALSAIDFLKENSVDLIFLDIRMPEINGIELLKILGNKYKVILTTAYAEYAHQGFEFDVIDYLLKPITLERFLISINKLIERTKDNHQTKNDVIFVRSGAKGSLEKIVLSDVYYIEACPNYVSIHNAKEKKLVQIGLYQLEKALPKNFKRVHKSYIINTDKISSICGNLITLYGPIEKLPIGNTYKEDFIKSIENKIVT
ncbi:LytR/AlgR family response regulator transcription factor [Chitinophaga nivalis]|uniref:LytTR family DNA-binding domain-containing protein n=1 Tax=Chitinophaga nivalis TaxID=2991709 RepID=A0ABT3II77_9BACT|nr:LytTR family DNA-binding domain-containing protein [Chitinophaga nivalis]MCW3466634.1 LytTR family DNA-binding domain-containing protein [Chitinophaga nivalis]MCW3483675.1 LytTR family DNA-binding domain-containing protein [Chitinophaga nivalis]